MPTKCCPSVRGLYEPALTREAGSRARNPPESGAAEAGALPGFCSLVSELRVRRRGPESGLGAQSSLQRWENRMSQDMRPPSPLHPLALTPGTQLLGRRRPARPQHLDRGASPGTRPR